MSILTLVTAFSTDITERCSRAPGRGMLVLMITRYMFPKWGKRMTTAFYSATQAPQATFS